MQPSRLSPQHPPTLAPRSGENQLDAASAAAIATAVERLWTVTATRRTCAPVRDLLGPANIRDAYAVQEHITARRIDAGARIIGRKIGLTSVAVQRQIGVDQPDFGALFDNMLVPSGELVPSARLLQPKAEAEVAFFLESDLNDVDLDMDAVRSAVAYASAALEICDSRISNWDITIADTVADNASSGMFVLGDERVALADFDPAAVTMALSHDGVVASEGSGAACMGDPLNAVLWLARMSAQNGSPLRKGDVVLSGALGPMIPVAPGSSISAEVSGLGKVSARFSTEES